MISSTGLKGKLYTMNKVAFEVAISASQKCGELERNGVNLEYPHVSKVPPPSKKYNSSYSGF